MQRLLAIGCCALYVGFGFVADLAHVHEAADHHAEMRGLHFDHAHLGAASDHDSAGHHAPPSSERRGAPTDARHVGHHDADVLYLAVAANRALDAGLHAMPALVSSHGTTDPPAAGSARNDEPADRLRGPPRKGRTRPRAPPA